MTRALRVLHLEDSARDAEIIRHRLDADGLSCSILVARGKESFEAALAGEPFDVIISDYNLPGYDGVAALKTAQAVQPDVPVILVSGTVVDEQAVKCLHIGATDYLLKQRLERLVPAVERAVEEADTRRARKHVETALAESESRKAAILDSVLDCIVTMDADGTVIEFNTAAARTFGYTKADAIGRPLADLIIPPQHRDAHRAGLARYVATGEATMTGRLIEMSALRSDGSEIPVELTITAIRSGRASIFTGVLRDITARKIADAIRSRLVAIVDSSDDAIVSMALDDTFLTWNAGAERLYGYTAAEVIGRKRALIVPAGQIDEVVAIVERAARGEASPPLETQRMRKDGSVVDISLVVSPMTDPGGRITSVSMIARDITERRRAEAAVRDERDRAQRFLDTAEVILLSLDLQGRITLVNRYACSLFDWSAGELLGRDFIDTCVPARARDETRSRLGSLLTGSDSSIIENPVVTRSGAERLIEWRNHLLRDDEGRVTSTLSSGTDVTERRLAEATLELTTITLMERTQALEQHETALNASEERTNYALEAGRMGVWELDLVTQRVTWSRTMAAMYGLTPEMSPTTTAAFMALIHPDDRGATEEAVKAAVVTGADFDTEFRVVWPDGSIHWNAGRARVLRDAQGRPARVLGVGTDISERKLLEAQFRQAQKMEAIGQLAGGVAHDFNNLLTAILGYSNFVIDTLGPQDARRADMEEILKAGQRAASLTRQLLAFSRKQVLQPTSVNLNALVTGIRTMLSRLIGEHVDLVQILAPDLGSVRADPGQLEQVIMNLVVNARDAMPSGGRVTVETANVELDETFRQDVAVIPGSYVMLAGSDSGVGMNEGTKSRLFEPFFTTKEAGKGTGLGLATVWGIVKQSGGYIWVFSEPGQGATFKVYLPCSSQDDAGENAVAGDDATAAATETVLVVEDEDAVRLLTRRILERAGYRVFDAPNPEKAEALFERHKDLFDLLVTDVVMPGSSGPRMFERLVRQRPDLKVLYVSGYTDDTIVHQGKLNPGIELLQKPFTADALKRRVREVLDR